MYIEVDRIMLVPGNYGKDCPGNGLHKDSNGNIIECLCDECDFLLCCTEENYKEACEGCPETECPRLWEISETQKNE